MPKTRAEWKRTYKRIFQFRPCPFYILDSQGKPVQEYHPIRYADWMIRHDTERVLKCEKIGAVHISTVFLGVALGYRRGRPILWETAIIRAKGTEPIARYTSAAQAERGHRAAMRIFGKQPRNKRKK
jgi:hypothetical protein